MPNERSSYSGGSTGSRDRIYTPPGSRNKTASRDRIYNPPNPEKVAKAIAQVNRDHYQPPNPEIPSSIPGTAAHAEKVKVLTGVTIPVATPAPKVDSTLSWGRVFDENPFDTPDLQRRLYKGLPQVMVDGNWHWDAGVLREEGLGEYTDTFINNLRHVPNDTNVDFSNTNDDPFQNLTKSNWLDNSTTFNYKDRLNDSGGPSGIGKYARFAVPALAAIPMGFGVLSQLGAFGPAATLTGSATSAMPAGGAGLNALDPALFSAGSGANVAASQAEILAGMGLGGIGGEGAIAGGTAAASAMPAGGAGLNALNPAVFSAGSSAGTGMTLAETLKAAGTAAAGTGAAATTGLAKTLGSGIPWDAIITAGSTIAGGYIGYTGAGDAADAQEDAAKYAADITYAMYQQGREDLAPWREAGTNALAALQGRIAAGPGEFEESPGYQWTLDQGLKAQQNALSAMGANRSGRHIKAATEYAEGLASTEYDNFLNRWYRSLTPYQSLAGIGQTSAGQTASMAQNTGSQLASNALYGGQASAAGTINQANALTGAITGGANQLLYLNALRNLPNTAGLQSVGAYSQPVGQSGNTLFQGQPKNMTNYMTGQGGNYQQPWYNLY